MRYLKDELEAYGKSDFYPLHMPGHKRKKLDFPNPYSMDITEIDGFDNLHHAKGIIKEACDRAGKLYGSKKSYFLINGSSGGILSAMGAVTKRGDQILVARDCHKSVYHAMEIRGLKPVYLYPQTTSFGVMGAITVEQVKEGLKEHPHCKCVILTSPTYDGIVSDIEGISKVVHQYGIPFIVDEAHGAHFGFHEYFPQSALSSGADLVIQSLHKTMPAFTQTAILHVGSFQYVEQERLEENLAIYQTSSPSYILMAGMDECIRMVIHQGQTLFEDFVENLSDFYQSVYKLEHLEILRKEELKAGEYKDLDPSKIIIQAKRGTVRKSTGEPVTGELLGAWLRQEFHLEVEMVSGNYVLAMTTICDRREGFERLKQAIFTIDKDMEWSKTSKVSFSVEEVYSEQEVVLLPADAREAKRRQVTLAEGKGKISAEYVYLYPPGIPILVPGERITEKLIRNIGICQEAGLSIEGLADENAQLIKVVIP